MLTREKKFKKVAFKLILIALIFTSVCVWTTDTVQAKYDYTVNISFRCQGYPAELPFNYLRTSITYKEGGFTSSFKIYGTDDSKALNAEDTVSIMWPSEDSLVEKIYVDDHEFTPQIQGDYQGIEASAILLDKMGSPEDKAARITLELKSDERVTVIKPYKVNFSVQEDGQEFDLPEGILESSYFSKSQETPFKVPTSLSLQKNDRVELAWTEEQTTANGFRIVSATIDGEICQPYRATDGKEKLSFYVFDKDVNNDNIVNIIINVKSDDEDSTKILGKLEYDDTIEVEQDSPFAQYIERYLHREVKIVDVSGTQSDYAPVENWQWESVYNPGIIGEYLVVGELSLPEGWKQADPPLKVKLTVKVIPKSAPLEPEYTVDKIGGYSEFMNAVAGSDEAAKIYSALISQSVYVLDLEKQEKIVVPVRWESDDGQLIYSNVPGHYKMRGRISLPLDWQWKDQEEFIYTTLILEKDPNNNLPENIQLKENEVKFWLSDQILNKPLTWHFEDGFYVFDANNQQVEGTYLKGQAYVMDKSWRVEYIVIDPNFTEDGSEVKNFGDLYLVEVNGEERHDLMRVEDDPSNKNPDGSYKQRCIFTFDLAELTSPQTVSINLFALSPDSAELDIVFKNRVDPLPPENNDSSHEDDQTENPEGPKDDGQDNEDVDLDSPNTPGNQDDPDQAPDVAQPEAIPGYEAGSETRQEYEFGPVLQIDSRPVSAGNTRSHSLNDQAFVTEQGEIAELDSAINQSEIQKKVQSLPATGSQQSMPLSLLLFSLGLFLLNLHKKR